MKTTHRVGPASSGQGQLSSVVNRSSSRRRTRGFTLLEMIGVLAVIAILVSMLLPRVFEAIANARVNDAAVNCNTIKTATVDHYAKYGKLATLNGTTDLTLPVTNYCAQVLLPEGFLDKPFSARIAGNGGATNAVIQLVAGDECGVTAGTGFDLDGTTTNNVKSASQQVLQAVLYGVDAKDAEALSERLDGPSLSTTNNLTVADSRGRVEYDTPSGTTTTVYVYLTHR